MHYLQNIVNISEVVQYVHAMNNFSHFIEQPNLYILQLKNKTKTQFAVKRREKKRFPTTKLFFFKHSMIYIMLWNYNKIHFIFSNGSWSYQKNKSYQIKAKYL